MHKVMVGDHAVELGKIHAKLGWKILHDLGRICGESLVEASEDRFAEAIAALFKNSSSDELFEMMEKLADYIIVDHGKLDLTNYSLTMKCIKELLMFNFSDFFSPLEAALKGLMSQVQQPNEPNPSQS
jgi:hypothetical protein